MPVWRYWVALRVLLVACWLPASCPQGRPQGCPLVARRLSAGCPRVAWFVSRVRARPEVAPPLPESGLALPTGCPELAP
eukprot:10294478-Alexandrium_andersonii.AAC.1